MDDGMQIIEKSAFVKSADSEDGVFFVPVAIYAPVFMRMKNEL